MRVIEDRYIKEMQAFCTHCGATLGYYPADKKENVAGGYVWEQLKCPICGKLITIKKYSVQV